MKLRKRFLNTTIIVSTLAAVTLRKAINISLSIMSRCYNFVDSITKR